MFLFLIAARCGYIREGVPGSKKKRRKTIFLGKWFHWELRAPEVAKESVMFTILLVDSSAQHVYSELPLPQNFSVYIKNPSEFRKSLIFIYGNPLSKYMYSIGKDI